MSLIDNPLFFQQREQNSWKAKNIEFIDMTTGDVGEKEFKVFGGVGITPLRVVINAGHVVNRHQW